MCEDNYNNRTMAIKLGPLLEWIHSQRAKGLQVSLKHIILKF